MNFPKVIRLLSVLAIGGLLLPACSSLKPVTDARRFFALTPLSAGTGNSPSPKERLVVGIGRVDIPDYLQPKRIVFRKGNSEIAYSETFYWAERLDKGIQRVLVANVSSLLSSNNLVVTTWRRSDVQAEVYISVQRFESDERGNLVLEARWRIANPGAEKALHVTVSKISRQGPALSTDPDGAIAALSEAVGDLSREITAALRGELVSQGHL